jgi:hypothetical protein
MKRCATSLITVVSLLFGTAAECAEPGTGVAGDTPETVTIKVRAAGSASRKQVVVDWLGEVPTLNVRVGKIWSRKYYMRRGKHVAFTVTNRTGTGNVSCTIYAGDEIVAALSAAYRVECEHTV